MSFRLDQYIFTFLFISIITFVGLLFINNINFNYGTNLTTGSTDPNSFNETYNVVSSIYSTSEDMKGQTLDSDINDIESWESMTKGSYSAVRLFNNIFKLPMAMMNDIAATLGLPPLFITTVLAFISLSVIFGLIYLFMRFRPT